MSDQTDIKSWADSSPGVQIKISKIKEEPLEAKLDSWMEKR